MFSSLCCNAWKNIKIIQNIKYVKGPVQNQKKNFWNNATILPLCCNGRKRDFLDLLQRKLNDTNTETMYDIVSSIVQFQVQVIYAQMKS